MSHACLTDPATLIPNPLLCLCMCCCCHRVVCVPLQVCCVASFEQEPYLLLGCRSGAIRVAALVNASGDAITAARQVRSLQLRDYTS